MPSLPALQMQGRRQNTHRAPAGPVDVYIPRTEAVCGGSLPLYAGDGGGSGQQDDLAAISHPEIYNALWLTVRTIKAEVDRLGWAVYDACTYFADSK